MEENGNFKKHSAPVPQFYKEASKILKKYVYKEGALKTLIFQSGFRDIKKLMAVLSRIIENYKSIQKIIKDVKLLQEEPKFNPYLAAVLIHEIAIKSEKLSGDSKPIQVINKYFDGIQKEYKNLPDFKVSHSSGLVHPKYARINTLLISEDDFHKSLREDNWQYIKYDAHISYEKFLDLAKNLKGFSYMADLHVKSLLLFPPNFPFFKTQIYKKNHIILQNKSSCLPVTVCELLPSQLTVDACSAPGNKTCHLAAVFQNKGKIIAIDRDKKRYELLTKFLRQRGVTNVKTMNIDFTSFHTVENVHTILVDPSCSNSGILKDELEPDRLSRLAFFQYRILSHALAFPTVQRVVYSTCSTTEAENEQVVVRALEEFGDRFELCDLSQSLAGWTSFGNPQYPFGSSCITASDSDLCHGFFIAVFKLKTGVHIEKVKKRVNEEVKKKSKRKRKSRDNKVEMGNFPNKKMCN